MRGNLTAQRFPCAVFAERTALENGGKSSEAHVDPHEARAVADALDFQNAIRSPAAATATVVRCVTMCRAMCDPRRPARVFEFLRSRARFPPYSHTLHTARAESGDRARWPRARAAPPHKCG